MPEDGADQHRRDGDRPERALPVPHGRGERGVEHPGHRGEGGDLRAGGHERGDRGRCALVHVRGPGVERADGALEEQPHHQQAQPTEQQRVGAPTRLGGQADVGVAQAAGVAVEQRDAVQQDRRGEGAEQEVLDRRLLRDQPAPAGQPAHQVERQRQHLERDEQGDQIRRRREDQHAADREQRQREDLGLHRRDGAGQGPFAHRGQRRGLGDEGAPGLGDPVGHQQHRGQRQRQQHAPDRVGGLVDRERSGQRDGVPVADCRRRR